MGTSTQALVNPTVLTWARQESGYPPEPAAKRLNVKLERLLAWERGDLKPRVGLEKLESQEVGVRSIFLA